MKTRNLLRYVFAVLCAANILGSVEAQTVTWTPGTTYYDYRNSGNENSIKISNTTYNNDNHWEKVEFSGVETIKTNAKTYSTFTGNYDVSDAKVFAKFSTSDKHFYRIVAQDVQATISLPKYTSCSLLFAGNVTLGTVYAKNLYAFEMIDFGTTGTRTKDVTWKTRDTDDDENNTSVGLFRDLKNPNTNKDKNRTILRNGCSGDASFVGENCQLSFGDGGNGLPIVENHYYSVMAYVRNYSNSQKTQATATFGAKETYFYYATIIYDRKGGTGNLPNSKTDKAEGKNGTFKLNKMPVSGGLSKPGFKFAGWRAKDTGEIYQDGADFNPYDKVNGGGRGYVTLEAVWEPKTYTVTLNRAGGGGGTTSVAATFDAPMPSGDDVKAPTRYGYTFGGYYAGNNGVGVQYYTSNMSSAHNWDIAANTTLYAKWTANVCKVELRPNGTGAVAGTPYVMVTHGQKFPEEEDGHAVTPPTRKGYIFNGFYRLDGGNKKYFYDKDMRTLSCATWPYQADSYVLADWTPKTTYVTFDKQGGWAEGWNAESVTATYGEDMPLPSNPSLLVLKKNEYIFGGYYDQPNGQGTQYYKVENNQLVSARKWNKENTNAKLYAYWMEPIKYVLTLNAGSNTVIPTTDFGNGTHAFTVSEDRTTITMNVSLNENLGYFYNGVPKKPGFKFDGFYVGDILVAEATGDKDRDLKFTNNGGYINNSVWKYTDNLTLTAKWTPKYTLSDNILTFNNGEYLEVGIDWQSGKVNDLLGAAEYEVQQGHVSSGNPIMAFDIRNVVYQDGSSNNVQALMQGLQNKEYISPNLLVYVGSEAYYEDRVDNVVKKTGDEYKCNSLVVTDRYPMKIPYGFIAQKATYERNKAQSQPNAGSDGMWTQSSGSRWGTLCLPFDIKNMAHGIQFYELRDIHDGTMCFYELPADYVLPANTPVVYKRMSGAGSDISVVVNSEVGIEKNMTYATNDICYNDDKKAPHAKPTIKDWEFRGTLQEVVCCGKDYQNPPANAWVIENKPEKEGDIVPQDIFYFKQDSFTRLGTKTKATCLPYRAYFYRTPDGDSAHSKDSSFSILVMDTDGTTDITSLLDNKEVKANGRIYDLSGRRVMQPVKGRLYIVDGKKKVY